MLPSAFVSVSCVGKSEYILGLPLDDISNMPGKHAYLRHFHKTLPHAKGECSAPQIGRETTDGDSETREQGLQVYVSHVVAAYDEYVDWSR